MSDDPAPSASDEDEDEFSRAFRERWGDLADRAARLESGAAAGPDPAAPPPVRRDPTAPLWRSDTAQLPHTSEPPPPPPSYAAEPAPVRAHGQPADAGASAGPAPQAPLRPGDPLPSYGPPPGRAHPGNAANGPSAAALLIVSGVTMAFTMLFIGLPSLIAGALAASAPDPEVKARRLRIGWILYAVNWAFVVIGFVVLVVGLFAYVGTL